LGPTPGGSRAIYGAGHSAMAAAGSKTSARYVAERGRVLSQVSTSSRTHLFWRAPSTIAFGNPASGRFTIRHTPTRLSRRSDISSRVVISGTDDGMLGCLLVSSVLILQSLDFYRNNSVT
jgi:hypothetical protein